MRDKVLPGAREATPSATLEGDRLRRTGVAVLTAFSVHAALLVGIAVLSWGAAAIHSGSEAPRTVRIVPPKPESAAPEPVPVPPPPPPDEGEIGTEDLTSAKKDPNAPLPDPEEWRKGWGAAGGEGKEPADPTGDPGSVITTARFLDVDPTSGRMRFPPATGDGHGLGSGSTIGLRPGPSSNPPNVPRGVLDSVRLSLEWLQRHQSPDGRWDSDGFQAQCGRVGPCDGMGDPEWDVGLTGLSLAAYLGRGHTHRAEGPFRATVERALSFLRKSQRTSGCIADEKVHRYLYNHILATYALAEAYAMTGDPALREPVERGTAYLLSCRNPGKAWRYADYLRRGVAEEEDKLGLNDTSVTGWAVMALHAVEEAARFRPLSVDPKALADAYAGANAWLDEVQQRTKRYGLTYGYSGPGGWVQDRPYVTTAAGILVRQFTRAGHGIDGAVGVLADRPPVFGPEADYYAWYYSAYALFQHGGEGWKPWYRALIAAVTKNQRKGGGCGHGSMDPGRSLWSQSGGRVYSTACAALCMEVEYRYRRLRTAGKDVPPVEKPPKGE